MGHHVPRVDYVMNKNKLVTSNLCPQHSLPLIPDTMANPCSSELYPQACDMLDVVQSKKRTVILDEKKYQ